MAILAGLPSGAASAQAEAPEGLLGEGLRVTLMNGTVPTGTVRELTPDSLALPLPSGAEQWIFAGDVGDSEWSVGVRRQK